MKIFSTNPTFGPGSNSFDIIQPDHGTSPTASSPTDTLTLTSSDSSVTITGNAVSKTINFQASSSGTTLLANSLIGVTLANNVVQSSLQTVGTITSGIWNGIPTAGFTFLTSGTGFTTPLNTSTNTLYKVTLIGGGGGGGGAGAAGTLIGCGGGGGGVGVFYLNGISGGIGLTISIGGGGAGGATTPTNGGGGGNTSFYTGQTLFMAFGASGGISSAGGNQSLGGLGGGATLCTINIFGQQGGTNSTQSAADASGTGGDSGMGFGLGGIGTGPTGVGIAGSGYGSGGGGGTNRATTAQVGGTGMPGAILIEWQN